MDILGHRPFGTDAASFDPDLRAAVGEEGDRVGQAASALLSVTVEQLRRWADELEVTGPDRIAVVSALEHGGGRALVSVALGGPEWSVVLGHHEDEDRYGYSRGSDAWNALDAVVTLVLGGECHPSFVVDLDTCTVVTVVSDLELGDAGQVGDVLQLPSDDTVAVDFEGEMAAAEDLHLRCHEYGMAWPPVGP